MKLLKSILPILCVMSLFVLSAPAVMAQSDNTTEEEATATFEVANLVVEPSETTVGRIVAIKASVANTGEAEGTYTANLEINGTVEDSQDVTLAAGQTQAVEFTYTPSSEGTYNVAVGGKTGTLKVTLAASEAKFREGPVVKLRPVTDEIDSSNDGLVELFFSNPSINDVTLQVDVYVEVPSGIHVYGEGFGLAAAAGTVYGQFTAPPGTARTIYLNIKADKTAVGKTHTIHFSGLYWPEGNKDAYNPISLTHPLKVTGASPNPMEPAPTTEQIGGIATYWWIILVVVVLGGIAIIVAVSRRTEVSIEK
ncbi:CARDB domain-containing protein [Chloroflexota bacterium]